MFLLLLPMSKFQMSCVYAYFIVLFLTACSARWVKIDGVEYRCSAGVICGMEHDLPTIGQITSIFVINGDNVVLEVNVFASMYLEHFRVYTLQPLKAKTLICSKNLLIPHPLHIRTASTIPHQTFIILPHHVNA